MEASTSSYEIRSAGKSIEDEHKTLSTLEPEDTQNDIGLPKVLSRRDLTVSLVLIVVYISNVTGVEFGGSTTFLYWSLGLLTFLIPCAYVTQWLGRLFPGAGATYLWAARILGSRWAVFSAFCSWIPSVLSVVLGIQGCLLFLQYLVPTWFVTPQQQCIGIIGLLVLITAITCIPLRWLKHALLGLALLSLTIYALLGFAGIWWLWNKHPAAVPLSMPSWRQFNGSNIAIYGLVILAFLGVEVPLFLGGELKGGTAETKRAMSYVTKNWHVASERKEHVPFCSSTWIISNRSTTPGATRPVTRSSAKSPLACVPPYAWKILLVATAVKSSLLSWQTQML